MIHDLVLKKKEYTIVVRYTSGVRRGLPLIRELLHILRLERQRREPQAGLGLMEPGNPPEISDDDFNQSFIFLLQIFMPAVHCC